MTGAPTSRARVNHPTKMSLSLIFSYLPPTHFPGQPLCSSSFPFMPRPRTQPANPIPALESKFQGPQCAEQGEHARCPLGAPLER